MSICLPGSNRKTRRRSRNGCARQRWPWTKTTTPSLAPLWNARIAAGRSDALSTSRSPIRRLRWSRCAPRIGSWKTNWPRLAPNAICSSRSTDARVRSARRLRRAWQFDRIGIRQRSNCHARLSRLADRTRASVLRDEQIAFGASLGQFVFQLPIRGAQRLHLSLLIGDLLVESASDLPAAIRAFQSGASEGVVV